MRRREFVRLAGLSPFAAALLVACGDEDDLPRVAATRATDEPKGDQSAGELAVAEPFLPPVLDGDDGSVGTQLLNFGVAETLMRYTPDLQPEPWIAKRLERLDDLTWEVTIREGVSFWDGSLVDGTAVKTSIERSLALLPSATSFIPAGSDLIAEGHALRIRTPAPVGLMDHNLTTGALTIKKQGAASELLYTGPFRVREFSGREMMGLAAYEGYRGGAPRLAKINSRQVADAGTRLLALQAGDVAVSHALLPPDVSRLESEGKQVFAEPWARQHMIILNTHSAPLNDVRVRRAYSLAIDRESLRDGVMEGTGSPAYGIAPADIGHSILDTHLHDPKEAAALLEAAGWATGSDGYRTKNGERLTIKLGTYPGRAELEQFAVVIRDQLRSVGINLQIEQFQDVETHIAENEFESTTYSIGSAAFGDLSQLLATLYVPSSRNRDRYENAEVTRLYESYIAASEAAQRSQLLLTIQEIIGEDVPVIPLYNPFQIIGLLSNCSLTTPIRWSATSTRARCISPDPVGSRTLTGESKT